MQEGGINTGRFSLHSCRSAGTSKGDVSGTSIATILQSTNWSRTSAFKKIYLKDIQQVYSNQNKEDNFGSNLLNSEIYRWSKEKYFGVLYACNIQKKDVLKDMYLYSYKKIYSLRKLVVVLSL